MPADVTDITFVRQDSDRDLKLGTLPMMLVHDAVQRGQPTAHNCSQDCLF